MVWGHVTCRFYEVLRASGRAGPVPRHLGNLEEAGKFSVFWSASSSSSPSSLLYLLLLPLLHTCGVPAGCVLYILFLLILVFLSIIPFTPITMQRAFSSRSALTRAPFSKLRTSGVSVQQQRFAHKVRLSSSNEALQ